MSSFLTDAMEMLYLVYGELECHTVEVWMCLYDGYLDDLAVASCFLAD